MNRASGLGSGAGRQAGGAGGGAAAGLAAQVSQSLQRQRALQQRVDKEIAAMLDNFARMVSAAKVPDTLLRNATEGFQASIHAAKLVQSAEALLALASELKQHALFANMAALNASVDKHRAEFTLLTSEADAAMDGIAEDAAEMLSEIEKLRYS